MAAFLLMAGILSAQAKTVLTFSGLVESSTAVTKDGSTITGPQVLVDAIGSTYTLTFNSAKSQTLYPSGLAITTDGKYDASAFTLGGLSAGEQVTITLTSVDGRIKVKGGCTMNGAAVTSATNCSSYGTDGTYAYAMTVNEGVTSLSFENGTNSRYSRIATIEILSAEEAESITKPTISSSNGTVTITPGESSKGNAVATYYTIDNTTPTATNGTVYTEAFDVDAPTVVRAITLNDDATSEVVSAIVSPTTPRAKTLDLTAINTSSNVTLATTGITAATYKYAYNYLSDFYGTLAFDNPTRWTIGTDGLTSTAANDIFEIPNLKEGDQVTFTITTGRLQLYGQSTSNHLLNNATPSDGYANVAKAGDDGYSYTVTMLSDANLKVCTKDAAVNITAITVTEKEVESYEMPETRTPAAQNRGLWACQTADGKTFVSWRARKTDTDDTSYILYRNGTLYDTFTGKTNVTIDGTAETYTTDTYTLNVKPGDTVDDTQTMALAAGAVKAHSWMRIALADEPVVTNTGVMWNKEGVDDGYTVRYTPNDMSACDMDGDGQEELIVKWDPSNSQDNGYSGYTANVYIDCYKMDWTVAEPTATLMWRINLGQNIRAGAHYTMFLCYDFDGDGKGEMICKTSLGTKDGLGNYVFQSRITERGLDVTRDYTRTDDSGTAQKSNGHIGVGEEWLTVFNGTTGAEMASIDFYPKFNVVSDWHEPSGSSNKYNKGTRFKACVAFLDGKNPSAVYNRGYYSQSFFTAYNWNGTNLYEVWRHASTTKGEGLYGQGNHSLVVDDMDGDGYDEIGTGSAVLDHDGTVLWTSGFGHGDAHHLGDFDPDNEGLEIFYVNEEYNESPLSTALFDAATGNILQGHKQFGMDTGRGLAADISAAHRGAELFSKGDNDSEGNTHLVQYVDGTADWLGGSGDYAWRNGSLVNGYETTDEAGATVTNDKASYPNYRIYWDGDLLDEWMDSRHVDKIDDETDTFYRVYSFDTPTHPARTINGTKENPNLQTDLFGDWREEAIFYDYDVTGTTTKTVSSKSINDGAEFDYEWENRQYYLVVFTTTIPTEHKLPWLRDDHAYDMAIAWQNVGYNQPPHLSYSPVQLFGQEAEISSVPIRIGSTGLATFSSRYDLDFTSVTGVKAYTIPAEGNKSGYIVPTEATGIIKAGTGLLLKSANGGAVTTTVPIATATAEAKEYNDNLLVAAPYCIPKLATTVGTNTNYILNNGGSGIGFYYANNQIVAAGKAYLQLPGSSEAHVRLLFADDATGIRAMTAETGEQPFSIYNLAGQRLSYPMKGINIINGKKVFIK